MNGKMISGPPFKTCFPFLLLLGCGGGSEPTVEPGPGGDASADGSVFVDSEFRDGISEDSNAPDVVSIDSDGDVGPVVCPWSMQNTGLKGGTVGEVAFDSRADGVVFAASGSRVYRSTDSGKTWKAHGVAPANLIQFAFPATAGAMVAASDSGLLSSGDGGVTWSVLALAGVRLSAVHVDTSGANILVALAGSGLMRSTDGGKSWSTANLGVPFAEILSFSGSPSDPNTIVAGGILLGESLGYTNDGVLLRTTTGGTKWTVASSAKAVRSVRRCSANPSVLVAAALGIVAKSTDGGLSWSETPLPGKSIVDVAVTGADCRNVYASSSFEGLRVSNDGGATFGPALSTLAVGRPDLGPIRFVANPKSESNLVAGMYEGLFTTFDAGLTWTVTDQLFSIPIRAFSGSPTSPSLWMATWGLGAWTRKSPADPWSRVDVAQFPLSRAFTIAQHPNNADLVFIGGWPDLYRSSDGGKTFTFANLSQNTMGIGFDPDASNIVYVATQTAGLYKSTDGGVSWSADNGTLTPWATPSGTFIDTRVVLVRPHGDDMRLLGTSGKGVLRSKSGADWVMVGGSTLATAEVTCLIAGVGKALYACANDRIYRSNDGGDTWTTFGASLPLKVTGLDRDPATNRLFATTSTGPFVCDESADSWTALDLGCSPAVRGSRPALFGSGASRSLAIASSDGVTVRLLNP